MRFSIVFALSVGALGQTCKEGAACQPGDVLPFKSAPMGGTVGTTMQKSTHKWRKQPSRLPADAPNIMIIMFDDAGFGQPSAFGGKIDMPTMERLRGEGISYTSFHNTAMCSPTRASLSTGRNHHRVGAGQIAEFANDWDGYTGIIPKSSATIAEVLSHYGYATAAFGKDHNTPVDSLGTGPYDRTPTGRGYDYFYGFLAGESSQWEPTLWENDVQIPTPHVENYEDYHLTEDMAQKAIDWMRRTKAIHPDRPFFMWWTPGAVHGPHQVAAKWANKYKGRFSGGWDEYQLEVFEKQKAMGIIPHDATRPPRPEGMVAWDAVPEKEKAFQERLMEVFAGFLEHTDAQAGKVIDELNNLGIRDNTLIFNILSDNGASAEGVAGTIAELNTQNQIPSTIDDHLNVLKAQGGLGSIGGPKTDNMYNAAWAWAGDSPFRYTKLIAADFGGTRTPMVVSWPKQIRPDAAFRTQFHHVNDVAPTIYEILDITPPKVVDGHEQDPLDGVSFKYTFDSADAPDQKHTQYFDIMGSRGIYHEGYLASTFGPRVPWSSARIDLSKWDPMQDHWQLFNSKKDVTLMNNLASEQPEKLKELQELFMKEADENKALPVGGALYVLLHPQDMLKTFNTEWSLYQGMVRIPESEAPNIRSGNVHADIDADIPANVNGVLFCMGGYAGGVSLYALDGDLYYEYSALLLRRYKFKVGPLPSGRLSLAFDMKASPRHAGPATVTFRINGGSAVEFTVGRTVPAIFTAAEGFDVGMDLGSPVADDYFDKAPFNFEGSNLKIRFKNM